MRTEQVGKVDGYIWFVKDADWRCGAGKGHEDEEILWICQAHGSSGTVSLPCHSVMPGSKARGGRQLQAMSYEEQLKFKERKVMNNLIRIGKFDEEEIHMLPIMGMEQP